MTVLCPIFIHHLWLPHQFAHFENQNLIFFFSPPLSLFPSLPELQCKSNVWKPSYVFLPAAEMASDDDAWGMIECGLYLWRFVGFVVCAVVKACLCQRATDGQQQRGIPSSDLSFPKWMVEGVRGKGENQICPSVASFTKLKGCICLINAGLCRKQPSPEKEN